MVCSNGPPIPLTPAFNSGDCKADSCLTWGSRIANCGAESLVTWD